MRPETAKPGVGWGLRGALPNPEVACSWGALASSEVCKATSDDTWELVFPRVARPSRLCLSSWCHPTHPPHPTILPIPGRTLLASWPAANLGKWIPAGVGLGRGRLVKIFPLRTPYLGAQPSPCARAGRASVLDPSRKAEKPWECLQHSRDLGF